MQPGISQWRVLSFSEGVNSFRLHTCMPRLNRAPRFGYPLKRVEFFEFSLENRQSDKVPERTPVTRKRSPK